MSSATLESILGYIGQKLRKNQPINAQTCFLGCERASAAVFYLKFKTNKINKKLAQLKRKQL